MYKTGQYVVRLLTLFAVLGPALAIADGVFTDPCGVTVKYKGHSSGVLVCALGMNGRSTSGGTGDAGLNFFENHISPVHLSGFVQGEGPITAVYTDVTSSTWSTATTHTLLELDGRVKVAAGDPNANITLTLTGLLGGPLQKLGPYTFGPGTSTDLHFASIIEQATAASATETLTIVINGNATYNVDGSPEFTASPEPLTLTYVGGMLFLCLAVRVAGRRAALRRTASPPSQT